MSTVSPARGVTPGLPTNNGSFKATERAEATVSLAPHERTLDDLAAAGYVVDEWDRWQQGGCGDYAIGLLEANPALRFGVLGRTEAGDGDASQGWSEMHYFAHDDLFAYDSAGRHPLPYRGIALPGEEAPCDYAEMGGQPDWYGIDEEADPAEVAAAREHAARHNIVTADGRSPIRWTPPAGADGFALDTPEGSFDMCQSVSARYTAFLRDQGLEADWIQVVGAREDHRGADERWKEIPQHRWQHYVTRVRHEDGTIAYVDWTARQFDPTADFPLVADASYAMRWDEEYVVSERGLDYTLREIGA